MKDFNKIYKEIYKNNKYRKLNKVVHHGSNRLDHIKRVSIMSFYISRFLKLDYVSCTRGALLHDFFDSSDLRRSRGKYNSFLHEHPSIALDNSRKYFKLNSKEEDIILHHMYPVVKGRPEYIESIVVSTCDKLVSVYEFFRFEPKLMVYLFILFINS